MSSFFRGQLIDYSINYTSQLKDPYNLEFLKDLIYMQSPFKEVSTIEISDRSYEYLGKRSFPRSSLILQEQLVWGADSQALLSLYMVSRNMSFV